jgi:hypothetical protein
MVIPCPESPWNHGTSPLGVVIWDLAQRDLLYVTRDRNRTQTLAAALGWTASVEVAQVVTWAIEGQATGHEWQVCDACGEPRLTDSKGRGCYATPGCPGHLVRVAPRPYLSPKVKENLR